MKADHLIRPVLGRAKMLIAGHWLQGKRRNSHQKDDYRALMNSDCFCLYGAVQRATIEVVEAHGMNCSRISDLHRSDGPRLFDAVVRQTMNAIRRNAKSIGPSVIDWNDEPGRTEAEVVQAVVVTMSALRTTLD